MDTELPEVSVSVNGVDMGLGVVCTRLGGPYKPLPELAEGDMTLRWSEPDYDGWTLEEVRAVVAERAALHRANGEAGLADSAERVLDALRKVREALPDL